MTDHPQANTAVIAGDPCPFCEIVDGRAPADIVEQQWGHLVIRPLTPVVDGHLLVIPRTHVQDARVDPPTTAKAMGYAADFASRQLWTADGQRKDFNLLTSVGPAATQTVRHLHVHIVPRAEGDGLKLPWTEQR